MQEILSKVYPIFMAALLATFVFYICLQLWGTWNDEWTGYNASAYISDGYCNIAVVPIFGEVFTYRALDEETDSPVIHTNIPDTTAILDQAEFEPEIDAVLLLIDSPGGSPAAASEIAARVQSSSLPVAAHILDSGVSAAYLIASAAKTIVASPFADVGSLGVTMSYLDYSKQNRDQGIEYISLTSGKYKDYGTPEKPLTDEERKLLERDLSIWHDELVKQVATNRNLPQEDVAKLADGSSMPASLALEAKLIDRIGNQDAVRDWFAKELSMPREEIVLCSW